jgi:drug/metabolite transporter (DMT)-like permease
MRTEFICMAIVALTWGGYPLIARSSGVGGPLGALILTLTALVPISIVTIWQGVATTPSRIELTKLVMAGLLMGLGTAAFNFVANSRQLEASISIPIIDTAMLLISVLGAIVFFAEPITAKKLIGIALLVSGILVLKPQ